ncbi:PEGA domain-containing protein [Candidatus Bathyarchaeota archaeon]|nr:MAG: PEGA domain-containing protein [Candidatus Bathyarchaeota archaeon]
MMKDEASFNNKMDESFQISSLRVEMLILILCLSIFSAPFQSFVMDGESVDTNMEKASFLNANTAAETIQTYKDPELREPADIFPDGSPVFLTVSDGKSRGGVKMGEVENARERISVVLYDDGTYPDRVAGDGVYTGFFRVTTMMTTSFPHDPDRPHIVNCINLNVGEAAVIRVDLDGDGVPGVKEVKLTTIFNVRALAVKGSSAVILWTTSKPGSSYVEYGLDEKYQYRSYVDETPRLHHRILLSGLEENTTYHYRVVSVDVYGEKHVSPDYTFTTRTRSEVEASIRESRTNHDLPKTYYVKPDGDDSFDGLTVETAWRHISHAVQVAEAGDTIYVLDGVYFDEHITFTKSGLDIAPIRLLPLNGTPTLNGVDGDGVAITLKNCSHVEIAGLRIVNYGTGIMGEGTLRHIYLHNFEIENMGNDGINLDGVSVQECRITDFKIANVSLSGDEWKAIRHCAYRGYPATSSYNVEITNFTIINSYGEAVHWRDVERLHIHDGLIKDTHASDGLRLALLTHCSYVENVKVVKTGWHGIAIHDWTEGHHPCYNNVIRNCYVEGAYHGAIDLHSGTFNTVVENCTLVGPPYTVGIYFHNVGAGLLARNNVVKRMYRGLWAAGHGVGDTVERYEVRKAYFVNNTVYDNTQYSGGDGGDGGILEDVKFINNTFINCSTDSRYFNLMFWYTKDVFLKGNRFISPAHPENPQIQLKYCTGKVIIEDLGDEVTKINLVDSVADVRFSQCTVFTAYSTLRGSLGTISYQEYSGFRAGPTELLTIRKYNMTAVPSRGMVEVTVKRYELSHPRIGTLIEFEAKTADRNNVVFRVGGLIPSKPYIIKVDRKLLAEMEADRSGYLTFNNSEWPKPRVFRVESAEKPPTGAISGTVRDESGAPIRGANVEVKGFESTITDEAGRYVVKGLPIGEYEVTVSAKGYETAYRSVVVNINQTTVVDFTLRKAQQYSSSQYVALAFTVVIAILILLALRRRRCSIP